MNAVAVDAETVDRLRTALTRISRRIDRQVNTFDLTSTQLSVLASVANRGPIGLGELAEIQGINPTMLSRVVSKLEEAQLIQRQVDLADRRAVRVVVTPAGAKLRRRVLAQRSALLAQRLVELSPDTVATIVAALPAIEELANELEPRRTGGQ